MGTIPGSCSIYRANMDGSSISLVMNVSTALNNLVLDRQHPRMYMEFKNRDGLFVFDILDGYVPLPVPAFSSRSLASNVLKYVSGNIFIWLVGGRNISQAILSDEKDKIGKLTVLYQRKDDENYLEILPPEVGSAENQGRLNPCVTKNCSHICAF